MVEERALNCFQIEIEYPKVRLYVQNVNPSFC